MILCASRRGLKSNFPCVIISVTQHKEPDLTKVFPNTNIDWIVMERQLVTWSELYRAGKKLRLNLSFIYVENSYSSTSLARVGKRGASSTTPKGIKAARQQNMRQLLGTLWTASVRDG
jgi:hypothetical protein